MPTFAPNVVQRLTLARYQIARARLQLVNATEFSAWQAAIALHDAADIAVLAIADHLKVPRKKKRHMHEFPQLIEGASGRSFYDRALIEEDLSEVRNPAKHRGGFPSVTDVRGLLERTIACLDENCVAYLGHRLADFSLADMIVEPQLRTVVKEAEQHIQASRFSEALTQLQHAFHLIETRFRARMPDRVLPELPLWRMDVPRDVRRSFYDLERWWDETSERLELMSFGIDMVRYAMFKSVGPDVVYTGGGIRRVLKTIEDPVLHTAESAEFGLGFVLDTVVRLQDLEVLRERNSRYTIRVKRDCRYYQAGAENAVGELTSGFVIDGARIGLNRIVGTGEAAWFWNDPGTGSTCFISLDDADVQAAVSRREYDARIVQQRIANQGESELKRAES